MMRTSPEWKFERNLRDSGEQDPSKPRRPRSSLRSLEKFETLLANSSHGIFVARPRHDRKKGSDQLRL